MLRFIFRRTLQMIPTLLAVVLIIFVIFSVVPGSFISSLMAEGRNATNADVMAHLNTQFGLDKPLPVRLWNYLWGLAHFDLGISYRTRSPVWDVIGPRFGRRSNSRWQLWVLPQGSVSPLDSSRH